MYGLIDNQVGDLALYAKVVEAGGFTAASRITGVPQATISRRIAELEDRLDVRLLERTTRKVSVTQVGRKIYEHARRIVEEVESAGAVATSLKDEPSGLIRMTAPVVLGQHLLAPAIASFLKEYPKVSVQVELTGRRVDLVEEGFDLAIRVGELDASSLIRTRLTKANAAYFANNDISEKVISPSDIESVPWLHAGMNAGTATWDVLHAQTHARIHQASKEPTLVSSDVEILVESAKAGLGIAILPEFAAPNSLNRVLPGTVAKQVEINALVVSHKSILPSVRSFIDHLKNSLAADVRKASPKASTPSAR